MPCLKSARQVRQDRANVSCLTMAVNPGPVVPADYDHNGNVCPLDDDNLGTSQCATLGNMNIRTYPARYFPGISIDSIRWPVSLKNRSRSLGLTKRVAVFTKG